MRAIVILLALGALTAGCAIPIRLYDGDKRPRGEIAVIMHGNVQTIDGRWFTGDGAWFEVPPGVYVIGVILEADPSDEECARLWDRESVLVHLWDGRRIVARVTIQEEWKDAYLRVRTQPVDLGFRAEAGHVYEVGKARLGLHFWIWIFDQDSGEIVAGAMPRSRSYTR